MPVRMKDIARDLGVSVVTVSKVLRNHADIGDETRARVLRRVKELHYRPNMAARALITGRSSIVGLVVPDLLHPFFARIAKALSAELRQAGYGLLISSSEEDPRLERQEIEQMLARRVDAILIASAQSSAKGLRRIREHKTPYVLLDRQFSGVANFVGNDDAAVGMLATRHLVEQGCKRIAHIRGPAVSTAMGRLRGYRRALADAGLAPLPGHIIAIGSVDDRGDAGGYEAARKLLAADPRPDAIFCYNDPVALGAMQAILEGGLRIPRDVAIIGCGNVSYSAFLRVPLSSIDQDSATIGFEAAKRALALINCRKPLRPEPVIVGATLVARASSLRSGPGGRVHTA
ncbi:MAG: LacI family DNA-binding transcriptional regulator [Bryobacteraceae bacterium]